jgi:hypothetical protein
VHVLQVEAQIEAVSRSVDEATKALPNLSKDQQTAQVRAHATTALCRTINIALLVLGRKGQPVHGLTTFLSRAYTWNTLPIR